MSHILSIVHSSSQAAVHFSQVANMTSINMSSNTGIKPIQDGSFRGCLWMGGKKAPLPKICQ